MNKNKKIVCPDCGWMGFSVRLEFKETGQNILRLTCIKCRRGLPFATGRKK